MTVTVRVMRRESIGRPVQGDRSKLARFTYGVAEYHGNRCSRVLTGTDSLETAVELADKYAGTIGAVAEYTLNKKRVARTKDGKAKAVRASKVRDIAPPTRTAQATDVQKLHMRDIHRSGTCRACGAGPAAISITCGSDVVAVVESPEIPVTVPAPPAEPVAPLTGLDAAYARLALLRGE